MTHDHELIAARMANLEEKIDALVKSVDRLSNEVAETKEIVAAWKSVKLWAQFIKWVSGISASIAGGWIVLKAVVAAAAK